MKYSVTDVSAGRALLICHSPDSAMIAAIRQALQLGHHLMYIDVHTAGCNVFSVDKKPLVTTEFYEPRAPGRPKAEKQPSVKFPWAVKGAAADGWRKVDETAMLDDALLGKRHNKHGDCWALVSLDDRGYVLASQNINALVAKLREPDESGKKKVSAAQLVDKITTDPDIGRIVSATKGFAYAVAIGQVIWRSTGKAGTPSEKPEKGTCLLLGSRLKFLGE